MRSIGSDTECNPRRPASPETVRVISGRSRLPGVIRSANQVHSRAGMFIVATTGCNALGIPSGRERGIIAKAWPVCVEEAERTVKECPRVVRIPEGFFTLLPEARPGHRRMRRPAGGNDTIEDSIESVVTERERNRGCSSAVAGDAEPAPPVRRAADAQRLKVRLMYPVERGRRPTREMRRARVVTGRRNQRFRCRQRWLTVYRDFV